jgi:sigma-B regulation protein RsbU (phosphoserine phosphatase)
MAELRARVHNILEVRLLHIQARNHNLELEQLVQELEASRDLIRLKTMAEQKVSDREFALAQETQQSLLPRYLPQFENFHIHAFNRPTRYVGGDFYDFLPLKAGEWVGVLADVSGKGMSAALLSSMVLGALNMEFHSETHVGNILQRINHLLCKKSLPTQFVTLFLVILNPNGAGHFVSAGHNPAFLFRAATGEIERLVSELYFLGMFDFASYQPSALQLDKGEILVVYSDGITDAENAQQDMFGEARLLEVMRRAAPAGSEALRRQVLEAIDEFIQDTPQTDDITFVVIEKYQ